MNIVNFILIKIYIVNPEQKRRVRHLMTEELEYAESAVTQTIRRLREEKGLSKRALAEMAGIDPAALSRIERGMGSFTLTTLLKIADALQISPSALFRSHPQEEERLLALYAMLPDDKKRLVFEMLESLAELQVRQNFAKRYGLTLEKAREDFSDAFAVLDKRMLDEAKAAVDREEKEDGEGGLQE